MEYFANSSDPFKISRVFILEPLLFATFITSLGNRNNLVTRVIPTNHKYMKAFAKE